MRLIHPFRDFVDPDELFDDVNGLNAYCNRLESLVETREPLNECYWAMLLLGLWL